MAEKKAFVFDTNFIIQNQNLDEVLDKLKEKFSVYITQVSIDERIAQNCRDLKAQFDEAEKCKVKFIHFATISFKKTYEEESEFFQKGMQTKYENYFGDNIIPFTKDGETLTTIIDRANRRLPPFSAAKDASDKGFKDCLLWLSMLAYFRDNGEDDVIFVTDDKSAFRNNTEYLQKEFHEVTGKTIEIHPNNYYKELLKQPEKPTPESNPEKKPEELPNLDTFREEVEEAIEGLRGVDWKNCFGDPQWSQTFTTSVPFNKDYTKTFFAGLRSDIADHIFEKSVPASKLLDFDGRVIDCDTEIPMQNLEKALRIYQAVLSNYSQYSEQFFEAATKILNRNYKAPPALPFDVSDDDLPF